MVETIQAQDSKDVEDDIGTSNPPSKSRVDYLQNHNASKEEIGIQLVVVVVKNVLDEEKDEIQDVTPNNMDDPIEIQVHAMDETIDEV